jgi:hypothetical protein
MCISVLPIDVLIGPRAYRTVALHDINFACGKQLDSRILSDWRRSPMPSQPNYFFD